MSEARVFAGPSRYVQGPGALARLGEIVASHGSQPFVVIDSAVRELLGDRVDAIFADSGLSPTLGELAGEVTYDAVRALSRLAGNATVVVGIGGGKALDAAKALALIRELPVITVPTIASNDSPASAAIAMYDDRHVMVAVDRLPRHPDAVVVDTELIANAPAHFLRNGIGDAVSKKFEADACWAGTGTTPNGGRPLLVGAAIADACYRVLRRDARAALAACAANVVDDALEAVVEAVILLSGLGFENGGLSLAHALTRGLMRARGAASAPHGEHVAWALLVQLHVEGRPAEEISELAEFLRSIDLPTTLGGLGMNDPVGSEILAIADAAMTAPHVLNMPRPVDSAAIAASIRSVEAIQPRQIRGSGCNTPN